jgi:undecaprenyl-diphosphatase
LDWLMPAVSALSNHGEVWILLAVLLVLIKGRRREGLRVGAALLLDLLSCNLILKPLVGRVRPCMVNSAVELLVAVPTDASFPSGHTAASFAAVFALYY